MQELTGNQGKASAFYLKLDDPANADAVVTEIKAVPGMQTYVTHSMQEYLSMMTPDNIPHCRSLLRL